jgi:hypothetical protein
MSLKETIKREFHKMEERGWDKIFWCIDFHDTIMPGSYTKDDGKNEFYPDAIRVLKKLTERSDSTLTLWTSSYEDYVKKHIERLKELGIVFDHFNCNPDCPSDELCNFDGKFYFNVLIDDKAGFVGSKDWKEVEEALEEM